jgi:hypothetical protein
VGSFYTNITLREADAAKVAAALRGRSAFVASTATDCVVFDAECEKQDPELLRSVGAHLSRSLRSPALAVMNHDDDVLVYMLFRKGKLLNEYNSNPGFFEDGPDAPVGGDASKLCKALGCRDVARVAQVLQESNDTDRFVFASDRHLELVRALQLPEVAVGLGFDYLDRGETSPALDEVQLVRLDG